jgi:ribosome maturation factor RimP
MAQRERGASARPPRPKGADVAPRPKGADVAPRPASRPRVAERAGVAERAVVAERAAVAERGAVDLRALRARLVELIDPVVTAADLELDELTVSPAGRRLMVRVTVDGETGIGHDELSDISREISAALDDAEARGGDLTPGAYTLEVSSPGVDRPLTLPRHWRRNVGRLVTVRAGERTVTARIMAADADEVTLEGTGPVAFDRLGAGRVQLEFTRLTELADDDFGEEFDSDDDDSDDSDDDDSDDDANGADSPEEDEE